MKSNLFPTMLGIAVGILAVTTGLNAIGFHYRSQVIWALAGFAFLLAGESFVNAHMEADTRRWLRLAAIVLGVLSLAVKFLWK